MQANNASHLIDSDAVLGSKMYDNMLMPCGVSSTIVQDLSNQKLEEGSVETSGNVFLTNTLPNQYLSSLRPGMLDQQRRNPGNQSVTSFKETANEIDLADSELDQLKPVPAPNVFASLLLPKLVTTNQYLHMASNYKNEQPFRKTLNPSAMQLFQGTYLAKDLDPTYISNVHNDSLLPRSATHPPPQPLPSIFQFTKVPDAYDSEAHILHVNKTVSSINPEDMDEDHVFQGFSRQIAVNNVIEKPLIILQEAKTDSIASSLNTLHQLQKNTLHPNDQNERYVTPWNVDAGEDTLYEKAKKSKARRHAHHTLHLSLQGSRKGEDTSDSDEQSSDSNEEPVDEQIYKVLRSKLESQYRSRTSTRPRVGQCARQNVVGRQRGQVVDGNIDSLATSLYRQERNIDKKSGCYRIVKPEHAIPAVFKKLDVTKPIVRSLVQLENMQPSEETSVVNYEKSLDNGIVSGHGDGVWDRIHYDIRGNRRKQQYRDVSYEVQRVKTKQEMLVGGGWRMSNRPLNGFRATAVSNTMFQGNHLTNSANAQQEIITAKIKVRGVGHKQKEELVIIKSQMPGPGHYRNYTEIKEHVWSLGVSSPEYSIGKKYSEIPHLPTPGPADYAHQPPMQEKKGEMLLLRRKRMYRKGVQKEAQRIQVVSSNKNVKSTNESTRNNTIGNNSSTNNSNNNSNNTNSSDEMKMMFEQLDQSRVVELDNTTSIDEDTMSNTNNDNIDNIDNDDNDNTSNNDNNDNDNDHTDNNDTNNNNTDTSINTNITKNNDVDPSSISNNISNTNSAPIVSSPTSSSSPIRAKPRTSRNSSPVKSVLKNTLTTTSSYKERPLTPSTAFDTLGLYLEDEETLLQVSLGKLDPSKLMILKIDKKEHLDSPMSQSPLFSSSPKSTSPVPRGHFSLQSSPKSVNTINNSNHHNSIHRNNSSTSRNSKHSSILMKNNNSNYSKNIVSPTVPVTTNSTSNITNNIKMPVISPIKKVVPPSARFDRILASLPTFSVDARADTEALLKTIDITHKEAQCLDWLANKPGEIHTGGSVMGLNPIDHTNEVAEFENRPTRKTQVYMLKKPKITTQGEIRRQAALELLGPEIVDHNGNYVNLEYKEDVAHIHSISRRKTETSKIQDSVQIGPGQLLSRKELVLLDIPMHRHTLP